MDFRIINTNNLYKVFLLSALIFGLASSLLYYKFVGSVGRLSTSSAGEAVISPLILSYCATLMIGVIVFYLMYNKTSKPIKFISFITIGLSVIPFFLGASRGSIFALFVPFLVLIFGSFNGKQLIRIILIAAVAIVALIYIDEYMGSGLLSRLTGTKEAIETGGSSASRLDIWEASINQFINNPLSGDKLNTDGINHYPHNIYIEVLQQTGISGFIPFFVLIVVAFKRSAKIIKQKPHLAWLTVFFLQATMQNMFSGALYTAAWFWTGMAIVLSLGQSEIIKSN